MTHENVSSDPTPGVEEAVEEAQRLEATKRAVLQELQGLGFNVDSARVSIAHEVSGQIMVTDVSS